MKWNLTSLKKSNNSGRNIQASQVYLLSPSCRMARKGHWSAAHYCRATLTSATWRIRSMVDTRLAQAERKRSLRREKSNGSAGHREPEKQHVAGLPGSTGPRQSDMIPVWRASTGSHRLPLSAHPGLQTHNAHHTTCGYAAWLLPPAGKRNSKTNKQKSSTCRCNASYPWHPSACNQHFKKNGKQSKRLKTEALRSKEKMLNFLSQRSQPNKIPLWAPDSIGGMRNRGKQATHNGKTISWVWVTTYVPFWMSPAPKRPLQHTTARLAIEQPSGGLTCGNIPTAS